MKKYLTIISIIFLLTVLAVNKDGLKFLVSSPTAFAVGDLVVNWGVPEGNPIFNFTSFSPGQTETHLVEVDNGASSARPVGVRGIKTSSTGSLENVLDFAISLNGTDIYGGTSTTGSKTLAQFFTESAGPAGVYLTTLQPGDAADYLFKVNFQSGAGNEYQNKNVVFDLKIGISFEIPTECSGITFVSQPVFGTDGNDNLNGTEGNDIILGFEGRNKVNSGNGSDCIIGGDGADRINGGNGDDVILGGLGNDDINGSNGNDTLYGGEGNDKIDGSNGDDQMFGEGGNDTMDGSNGNDTLMGGTGNDKLSGKNGDDNLNGGDNTDTADGSNGQDTCVAETKRKCEF